MLNSSVFSQVGQDIHALESKKVDKHELYSVVRDVDGLCNSVQELRSLVDNLREELRIVQDDISKMK